MGEGAPARQSQADQEPSKTGASEQLKSLRELLERSTQSQAECRAQVEARRARCDEQAASEDARARELADMLVQLRRSVPGTPSGASDARLSLEELRGMLRAHKGEQLAMLESFLQEFHDANRMRHAELQNLIRDLRRPRNPAPSRRR